MYTQYLERYVSAHVESGVDIPKNTDRESMDSVLVYEWRSSIASRIESDRIAAQDALEAELAAIFAAELAVETAPKKRKAARAK